MLWSNAERSIGGGRRSKIDRRHVDDYVLKMRLTAPVSIDAGVLHDRPP